MKDQTRTNQKLIDENAFLKQRIQELEQAESERKRAEDALRESEVRYRMLFEGINDAVFVHDLDEEGLPGRFLQVNDVACRRLGYSREELLSLTPRDITIPAEYERIADKRMGLASLGDILTETIHVTRDGRSIPVESNIRQFQYFGKQVALSISRDIALRKRAEEAQQASEENFRRSLDESPLGIRVVTAEGETIYANRAILDIHGYDSIEDLKTTPVEKRYTPESYAEFQIRREKRKRGDYLPSEYEISIVRKDSDIRHLQVFRKEVLWGGERHFQVIYQDITDRKRVEATLHLITDNMSDMIRVTDLQGVNLYTSPSHFTVLGYKPEERVGKTGFEIVHPDDVEHLIKAFSEGLINNKPGKVEYRIKHAEGHYVWLETMGDAIRDDQGEVTAVIQSSRDISERKQAEEEIRRGNMLLSAIIENIPNTIFLKDAKELRFVLLNRAGEDLTGYSSADLRGKNDYDFVPKEQADFFAENDREVLRGKDVVDIPEESLQTRTRGVRTLHTKKVPILNANGDTEYLLGISEDITDRKRMEEELLRAHKLESLGVLAGGIAHDFNNLMAIVQGYIDLALIDLPPDHVSRQRLLAAVQSVEQTKDLTSRLITFSRGGGPLTEVFDISEIIRAAVRRTVKGTEVRVKFGFMENLWPVEVDEHQMNQVFYNLTTNAVEAMPQGGNLSIQAENALIPAGEIIDLKEGSYLKITFADEGIGIPEEHLSKIFDPYFTTKKMAAQKGLGLGLSVCYSVLKKHGGHITVKSQPGECASFVLYLPARADLAREKESKEMLSTGTIRVLIMDDEPHIREIERAYLERMGYEVTDVKDGQEAIDTYRKALQSETPFDLMMLDLTVRQGMGGRLAMEQLLKIDPKIRAIIASGYVDDPVIENFADYGFLGALKKPFKGEEMKSLVEKILHG